MALLLHYLSADHVLRTAQQANQVRQKSSENRGEVGRSRDSCWSGFRVFINGGGNAMFLTRRQFLKTSAGTIA
ncbi:MAG: hypothetical protein AAB130_01480, partial [Nitrospirota bacterium]